MNRVVALEQIKQQLQHLRVRTCEIGIAGQRKPRLVARRLQQRFVLGQPRHAKLRQAALPRAEHLAAAAKLQIFLGDDEAVLGALHHIEPRLRRLRQRLAVEQDAGGLRRAATDTASQLMELRKPEALGMLDDHDGRIRHVDADLDHRGRHQDGELACGERRHDPVLLLAREPPMHQTDLVAEALLEVGVALLCRGDVQHLGLGDERADPIDLRAFGDGAGDAADHLLLPFARHDAGGDRLPPRRLLVESRHVHVAVAREQQCARDRRRRHHQKLGAAPGSFRLQRQPLMHAEPMLLVDHHKSEVAERDGLLEQRVRADENVDATFGERGEDLLRAQRLSRGR